MSILGTMGNLIGMPEAARRMGVSSSRSAKRALKAAGMRLIAINERALAIDEDELQAFITRRGDYTFGRPKGAKNKPKPS